MLKQPGCFLFSKNAVENSGIIFFCSLPPSLKWPKYLSCSWHQTTKQTILFSPVFSMTFLSLSSWKRKQTLLVQNSFFSRFGPMKSLFSFYWEKFAENKIGCLVVWCQEQLSRSAHWTPNFMNPEFQFLQFKVLQSVFSSF